MSATNLTNNIPPTPQDIGIQKRGYSQAYIKEDIREDNVPFKYNQEISLNALTCNILTL